MSRVVCFAVLEFRREGRQRIGFRIAGFSRGVGFRALELLLAVMGI